MLRLPQVEAGGAVHGHVRVRLLEAVEHLHEVEVAPDGGGDGWWMAGGGWQVSGE